MPATPSDMYMNFLDASVTTDATASTTLASAEVATGLSIRGGLAFLIHKVEVMWPFLDFGANPNHIRVMLSTKADQAALPDIGDQGAISGAQMCVDFSASGGLNLEENPKILNYLPPIPVASPKIVAYVDCLADDAAWRGKEVGVRVGFTTVKIDSKLYTELAETWGFSN